MKKAWIIKPPFKYSEEIWQHLQTSPPATKEMNRLVLEINQKKPYFSAQVVVHLASIAYDNGILHREFQWILDVFIEALQNGYFE